MEKRKQTNPSNRKVWFLIVIASLFVAIISHFYFIYQKSDGILMTGFNDGLSQMIPFKKFIYDQYTNGNFFYSDYFGLGGGFYSQLGYYYSTNLFFLFHVAIVFLLETIGVIGHPDIEFWADAILPMSILKLTLTLIIATYYFRQVKFGFLASFLGAAVYGINVLYFRHTMYWDFFSDAFFWFVLLLIGIEKIIQKQSKTIFVIALACNLINNFYFSYVNLLLAFFYILLRNIIPLFKDEQKVTKQVIQYLYLGIISFLISAYAFIPSVAGYFNNYRPEYAETIPLFTLTDNILFNSRVIFLPIFIVIIVCFRKFYKHPIFRLYLIVSVVGIILHFVPAVGSMFNGFSAPQNRWEHILGLTFGGMVAFSLQNIKKIKMNDVFVGIGVYIIVAIAIVWLDDFEFNRSVDLIIPAISFILAVVLLCLQKLPTIWRKRVFFTSVLVFMIIVANTFQAARLMIPPKDKVLASEDVMQSEDYNSQEQRNLIEEVEQRADTAYSRLDWMVPTRNNTPIVQDYDGFSIYSSILNRNLLLFYYDHLQIIMSEESVSKYGEMGDRTNLLSILNGQFYMRDKENKTVPYGFQKILESENYNVYENNWLLPSFRKTDKLFTENQLINQPILTREQAMIDGAIIAREGSENKLPETKEITDYNVEMINGKYDGKQLEIGEEDGGIRITLDQPIKEGDLYISFYLDGIKNSKPFLLEVNEFQTIRKEEGSIYQTGFNDMTIRIPADNDIYIKLPKGKYHFEELQIFHEDYQLLKNSYNHFEKEDHLFIQWNNDYVEGDVLSTKNDEIIITPIPYEKGWNLEVNGEHTPIERVNYAFIGIPLKEGMNHIEMKYRPPYFRLSCLFSVIGILLFWKLVRKSPS